MVGYQAHAARGCLICGQATQAQQLGTDVSKSPSDSTFRLLLAQLDVPGFETLLRDWMAAQLGIEEQLDIVKSRVSVLSQKAKSPW
jgi:hypothetical protein